MRRLVLLLGLAMACGFCHSQGLSPDRLGVIYNQNEASSTRIAAFYAASRRIPPGNAIALTPPDRAVITRSELALLRAAMLDKLPSSVQSLLIVWSRPYAVECMSITTAMAAGYQADFCEP